LEDRRTFDPHGSGGVRSGSLFELAATKKSAAAAQRKDVRAEDASAQEAQALNRFLLRVAVEPRPLI